MDCLQQNNFESFESFLLQNYKICPIHPKKQLCSLVFSKDQDQYLRCIQCILKSSKNNIDLLDILESDEKTIFELEPLKEDTYILTQLQDISKRSSFFQEAQDSAKKYFQNLKQKVDNIISNFVEQHMQLIEKASEMNEQIIEQYNTSICKKELKDILLYNYENYDEQNQLLSKLINQVIDDKQQINDNLKTSINELNKTLKKISDPNYSKIQNLIARNIRKIDLLGSNNALDNLEMIIDSDGENEKNIKKRKWKLRMKNNKQNENNEQEVNNQINSEESKDEVEDQNKDDDDDEDDEDQNQDLDENDRFSALSKSTNNSQISGYSNFQKLRRINRKQNNKNGNNNEKNQIQGRSERNNRNQDSRNRYSEVYRNNINRSRNQNNNRFIRKTKIIDLEPGKRGQVVTGEVIEVEHYSKQIRQKTLQFVKGRIADETGNIRFDIKKPGFDIINGAVITLQNIKNKIDDNGFHYIDVLSIGEVSLSIKQIHSVSNQRHTYQDRSSIEYIKKTVPE